MQKRFVAFLIAVLVAAGAGMATAQERFGGLTGIVTDASGGVLPGATVTISSKNTGCRTSSMKALVAMVMNCRIYPVISRFNRL